jgi:hypothetical protein
MDLRLRTEYEDHEKRRKNNFKYINNKSKYVPFSKSNLPVEDVNIPYSDFEDVDLDFNTSTVRFSKYKSKSYEALVDNNKIYNKCEVDNRDYNALYYAALKLRQIIVVLENIRLPFKISKLFSKSKSVEHIEMDVLNYQGNVEQDVGGDTAVVQTTTAHNVVLTETEVTQSDSTAIPNPGWSSFASSDVVSNMDSLVNRWFRVGTYPWSVTASRNTTLVSIDLPRTAVFQDTTTCNQPNQIPFRIHRYWRGDITVKIHINCNKFQIGQLQCSWYYQPKADDSFISKANVYTRSGTHHCVISAAPNNEAELHIPFKAFKSMYHTKTFAGDGKDLPLDLGTLFITVLSPLKTTGETSPRCSFTVFVKLENNEFTGMLAGNVDTPTRAADPLHYQMDSIGTILQTAVPIVEKLLTPSNNDPNRDNPPDNRPPSYFVPTASHSWSIGTNLSEPLQNLRLSGRAQTKHPDVDFDEMKIDVLKRKYMLLSVFSWSQQNANGQLLWSMPVNPIPPKDRMFEVSTAGINTLAQYQLTTVGFLSSMFQYWRGSIEYRFDIVASQFHSGKILLAYVPGIAEGATITIEEARASPNIVISLDNAMSYTWRIPYVADTPWWARRYAGESVSNNTRSPSKIFAFVLNELVLAETVPDSLEILVYMRGGEDMEFSIPVQPSIGLGYDSTYIATRNNDNIYPVAPTDTYYAGQWSSTPIVKVMRRAASANAVAQFTTPITDRPVFYRLGGGYPVAEHPNGQVYSCAYYILLRPIMYPDFIAVPILGSVTPNISKVETIVRAAFANDYKYGSWMSEFLALASGSLSDLTGFIPYSISDDKSTYGGGKGVVLTATTVSPTLDLTSLEYQGNREESLALVDNTQNLASTRSGFLTFGESFSDLKDLCRRYQIYGWTTVPKTNIERDPGACSFIFPVLPQGLELSLNTSTAVNQIWNRAREGHIPLIASLYRFYRGSIRIRIIVSNANGLTMWAQHRPDRLLYRDSIVPCTEVSTAEAVFNHTYGVYMQDMSVNSIVELEVPFYQRANFGLLQPPSLLDNNEWAAYYSLGEISVGFFGDQPSADIRCTIYYSIADDCRFSTYQGVPPMVLIDDLPEFQSSLRYQGNVSEPLNYQGFSDYFSRTPKEIGAEVADGATETLTQNIQPMLSSFCNTLKTQFSDTYESVTNSIKGLDVSTKLSHIASQIIHAVNNPSTSTIIISVISILITLGLITYSVYTVVKDYLIAIWAWIKNKVTSNERQEEAEVPQDPLHYQSEETHNAVTGFLSLICGGLCTLFGFKNDNLRYKSPSDCLFKNIDKGMKMSNVCFQFFRNLLSVIGDMKAWIVAHVYPGLNAAEMLMEGRNIIEKWVVYSQDLFDPMLAQNIKYDRKMQMKLLDCYAFGKILRVKALETQYPAIIQLINTTFDKLHKLHVDLVAQGIDPQVRKMPFTIYNYGQPEIGKSHLTTNLCAELCKDQKIETETSLMCILNATSKFWDNCDRQPCLVMDDAFNIRKGQMLEDQIASIFNVVSPVVLIPPKAAVEDKGRPYNPEIFIINSNIDFFPTELCLNDKALWRRRDILIKTELDLDFVKEGCIHCQNKLKVNASLPAEAVASLKDFHHLKFKYTFDVTNNQCVYQPVNKYLKYPELLDLLKDIFKKNRETENLKFADRVNFANSVIGDRVSLVGNVDNLEKLWNDAVTSSALRNETIHNTTLKTISKHMSQRVLDSWSNAKHGILKSVYDTLQPANNRYFHKNPECEECCRIKYQCMSCKIKLETYMRQHECVPSTSSVDSVEILDDKFQGNTVVTPPFVPKITLECNDTFNEWISNLSTFFSTKILHDFNNFLEENSAYLIYNLRRYPKYARSISVFKQMCERLCACTHNCSVNIPYLHDGCLTFINPQRLEHPDVICQLVCNNKCYMLLPWKIRETAIVCKKHHPENFEPWMEGMCEKDAEARFSFDSIFSNMVKYVYDFYYNKMKPAVKAVFSFFSTFGGWILGITMLSTIFSTVILGVSAYEVVNSSSAVRGPPVSGNRLVESAYTPAVTYQSKSYDGGKPKVNKVNRPKIRTPVKHSKDLEYQSASQFLHVEELLTKNSVPIYANFVENGKERRVVNYGLMLRDQLMLIQRHYYDFWLRLPKETTFTIPIPGGKEIPLHNFFDFEVDWFTNPNLEWTDSNFGVLHLPNIVPAFKNIVKFIAKSSDHEYIKSDNVYLYNCELKRAMHCNMNVELNKTVTGDTWLRLDECYSYKYSKEGLCGSVLLCSSLQNPIIGIHFAGNSTSGFSEPICRESFDSNIKSDYSYECHDLLLEDNESKCGDFSTLLYPQGTIPAKHVHHQGGVTQYIPSLIQGVYEVDTEPNPLSLSDPRLPKGSAPLKLGVEHMGKPPIDFENELLDPAANDLQIKILNTVHPVRVKIDKLSLQDVICGNVNVKGFEPLEWSSSEGFPLKSLRPNGVKGKKWLFNLDEEPQGYVLKGMHGELKRQLVISDTLRKKGIRVPTIFTDCLKDTCIDREKCKIPGKTRIFSISPVQYTIAFKQYFGDFLASYQDSRIDSEHGIGVNVDSIEWTQIANYLTKFGSKIVAGDYKNYGPSLMLKCVKKAFDIIMAWYERYDPDEERQLVRRVLLSEILHAKHLCLNIVYGVPCGIPSGSPVTTPLNSIVNCLYLRCAWVDIVKEPFSVMNDNVTILTYGDDVCMNVSDKYINVFNTTTLNKFFLKYNIVFTDIDKSDNIVDYRTLDNVTFLKRGFKHHPNSHALFLAPIDEQSIRKCVNWITRKGDPKLNTLENCKQACELAFGHGPRYYNAVRERLQHECVKKLGTSFVAPSWYEKSKVCYNL